MVSTQGFHEFNNEFGPSAIRVQFPVSELFFAPFFNITTSSLKEAQLILKEQNHVSRLRLCDWPGLGYLQCDKVNVP